MTPYEVLGIDPDATEEEAEDAYYRLLRIHHPDLHHGGSAEEIAAAEARTRALNLAMQRLRGSFGAPGPDGAVAPPSADGTGHRAPGDPATADAPPTETWAAEPAAPRLVACPFCGEGFTDGRVLRDHVGSSHKVRLEHRRRSRLGRQLDRLGARWQHISLWYLVPFNAVIALMIAWAVAPLATDFAYWVFAVAMAPSFIMLVDNGTSSR